MQNDHTDGRADDDGVEGDDRKGEYRDNPADFAASSNLARSGATGHYTGGGPTDSDPLVPAKGEQTWQSAGDGTNGSDAHAGGAAAAGVPNDGGDVGGIAASDAGLGPGLPDSAGELDPARRDATRGGAGSDAASGGSTDR